MAFDVQGALKEGYTKSEIADHLAKEAGYDIAGARKEGHSDDDIIAHLNPAAPELADRTIGDVAGGAVGAIGGGALGRSLQSGIREEYPEMFKRTPTPPPAAEPRIPNITITGAPEAPAVPKTGGENWVKSLTGANIPDAQMSKKDLDLAKGMRETVGRGGPMAGGSITESGIMLGPKDTAAMAKEAAAAKQATAPSMLSRAKDVAASANRNVGHMLHGMTNPWAIKTLGNALSGASAGFQGADAYQRFQDPNQGFIRAGVSGLGALGSLATMTRIPGAMPLGIAASTAAPFINEYLDEWAKEHPEAAKRLHLAKGGAIKPVLHTPAKTDLLMKSIEAHRTVQHFNGGGAPKSKLGKIYSAGEKIFGKLLESPVTTNKAVRASEAMNPHIGSYLGLTQSDNMGILGERMGGKQFPLIQQVNPKHAEDRVVWMTDSEPHSNALVKHTYNKDKPVVWSTYIGAPDQLKSNKTVSRHVYDDFLKRDWTPEQYEAINRRIATMTGGKNKSPVFPQPFDIRDRFAVEELGMDTFARRGALASMLGEGEGVGRTKQGIFLPHYQEILASHRDPMTVGSDTGAVGSRLFTVDKTPSQFSKEYHPDYDWTVHGQDQGVSFGMVPQELAIPDFYNAYRVKNPTRGAPVGNAMFGYNNAPQEITEQYLDNLYKAGYAEGGEVQHMAGGKLTGGLATLPKGQQAELQKLEQGYNRFTNQPAYQKAEMIGEALSDVPELAASFHPGYGLGYAGGALYDAIANTGDYGNAAVQTAFNAPGVLKPIGVGIKAAAPMLRQAMPVVGGLGALGAADAAEAGQGSKLKQIIGGVMDQYAPKAEKAIVPGAPHTYGPQATGPWMRDYQPAQRSAAALDDRAYWDQLAAQHQAAQNKVDYSMGRTGPTKPQAIQYMGKYLSPTPERMAAEKAQRDDAIRSAIENRKAQWLKRSREMGMSEEDIAAEMNSPWGAPWMP